MAGAIPSERWYGVHVALVTDNQDPEALGRVRVRLPWAPDAGAGALGKGGLYEGWARTAAMAAGRHRGSWFLPDVGDEVLVAFEAGHPGRPLVVGALWNGQDAPPVTADPANTVKLLRTRGGSEVRFDDVAGDETVRVRTAAGQSIELRTGGGGSVRVTDGHGSALTLRPSGVTVASSAPVTVQGSSIALEASMVQVKAAVLKCDGVIQGTTLVVESVVASTYTPGAGNVW
ncbi:MAG: phage baseplate assembly protein V [Vicinamibacterales bacterium]